MAPAPQPSASEATRLALACSEGVAPAEAPCRPPGPASRVPKARGPGATAEPARLLLVGTRPREPPPKGSRPLQMPGACRAGAVALLCPGCSCWPHLNHHLQEAGRGLGRGPGSSSGDSGHWGGRRPVPVAGPGPVGLRPAPGPCCPPAWPGPQPCCLWSSASALPAPALVGTQPPCHSLGCSPPAGLCLPLSSDRKQSPEESRPRARPTERGCRDGDGMVAVVARRSALAPGAGVPYVGLQCFPDAPLPVSCQLHRGQGGLGTRTPGQPFPSSRAPGGTSRLGLTPFRTPSLAPYSSSSFMAL